MFRLLRAMSIAVVFAACLFAQFARPAAQPSRPPVLDVPPGDTGRRITENGLVANYFPARQRGPALLTLSGSVGGLSMNDTAIALQAERFTVLHLSYFRGPGQNQNAELIPLEYFATALAWLQRQPEVDPARVGILGVSKGAEAALVVAARHPELKAIVAAQPSSVVWPGIIGDSRTGPISSSWSEQGKPVPHLPHVPYDASRGGTLADNFAASLKAVESHPESVIPVERIAAPILLVCGEADRPPPCWHTTMPATWRSVCLCRRTIHVSRPVAEQIEGTARRDLTAGTRRSCFSRQIFKTDSDRGARGLSHARTDEPRSKISSNRMGCSRELGEVRRDSRGFAVRGSILAGVRADAAPLLGTRTPRPC
jgi:uncharacterized protein